MPLVVQCDLCICFSSLLCLSWLVRPKLRSDTYSGKYGSYRAAQKKGNELSSDRSNLQYSIQAFNIVYTFSVSRVDLNIHSHVKKKNLNGIFSCFIGDLE